MSDFTVGERVALRNPQRFSSRTEWSIRQIAKITPSGQIRIAGIDVRFRQNGRAAGESYAEILHLTPEIVEIVRLHRARNAAINETARLPQIMCADKLSAEECERITAAALTYRAVLAEINEVHTKVKA